MEKYYYIQKGTDVAVDIWSTYGIYVKKTVGLNQIPPIKKPFSRDWADEQGDDTYLPSTTVYESKKVVVTFYLPKTTTENVKSTLKTFLNYVATGGNICYFDNYKKEGFRGYYEENKVNSESYREYGSYIEFDLEFICSNGICFGFDNYSKKSIFANIISGYGDFYFSNGTSVLNASASFLYEIEDGFVIICPSVMGGIEITGLTRKLLLTSTGKLLLTSTDKLLIT